MADIFWLASYPKSGNTWIRYLLSSYVFDEPPQWRSCNRYVPAHSFVDPGPSDEERLAQLSDWRRQQLNQFHELEAPIVLKTHYSWSADHSLADQTKGVLHVTRHPRDVAKSAFNHHAWQSPDADLQERQYLESFLENGGDHQWTAAGYGTWEEHEMSWTQVDAPYLLIPYETLCSSPISVFSRMIDFLGLTVDPARVARTLDRCQFDNLKALERDQKQQGNMSDRSAKRFFFNRGRPSATDSTEQHGKLEKRFDQRFQSTLRLLRSISEFKEASAG